MDKSITVLHEIRQRVYGLASDHSVFARFIVDEFTPHSSLKLEIAWPKRSKVILTFQWSAEDFEHDEESIRYVIERVRRAYLDEGLIKNVE